ALEVGGVGELLAVRRENRRLLEASRKRQLRQARRRGRRRGAGPARARSGRRLERLADLISDLRSVAEPLLGVLLETSAQQPAERSRHGAGEALPVGLVVQDRREAVRDGLAGERAAAGQHLVDDAPE